MRLHRTRTPAEQIAMIKKQIEAAGIQNRCTVQVHSVVGIRRDGAVKRVKLQLGLESQVLSQRVAAFVEEMQQ